MGLSLTFREVELSNYTWYRSTKYVDRALIKLLLLRQGIESNPGPDPGPGPITQRANVSVRTYNCNGLGLTDGWGVGGHKIVELILKSLL